MPSSNFFIKGEKTKIINLEAYKEMCLNFNPYKPYVVCPKYEEIWRKEDEEKRLFEEMKKKSATVQENDNQLVGKSKINKEEIKDKY